VRRAQLRHACECRLEDQNEATSPGREAPKSAVAGHAEQDNLHAIRSDFNTVITRPESVIRNSATQHFHYAQRLRLVRGYGAISAQCTPLGAPDGQLEPHR
jgi:hypothetical protein